METPPSDIPTGCVVAVRHGTGGVDIDDSGMDSPDTASMGGEVIDDTVTADGIVPCGGVAMENTPGSMVTDGGVREVVPSVDIGVVIPVRTGLSVPNGALELEVRLVGSDISLVLPIVGTAFNLVCNKTIYAFNSSTNCCWLDLVFSSSLINTLVSDNCLSDSLS